MTNEEPTVTINFPGRDGARMLIHLPWVQDKKLKDYLRHHLLRGRGLLHMAIRSKVMDHSGAKVRLSAELSSGEVIYIMARM